MGKISKYSNLYDKNGKLIRSVDLDIIYGDEGKGNGISTISQTT